MNFPPLKARSIIALLLVASLTVPPGCTEGSGPGVPPDYELLLAPGSLSTVQGTSPTVAVSISRTNFVGGVALFLTGAPANVTGTFLPGTTNLGSSVLTLAIGASVIPGSYTLVVNGNGAPGARTASLALTVSAAPNYTLELTPATLTISRGQSDSTVLSITRTNFAGSVTLSLGGVPVNVTSAFVPAAPTSSSSILTITVGAGAAIGTHNLTVDGTGSAGDRSTALTLTVAP